MSDHTDDLPNAPHDGAAAEVQEAASPGPLPAPEPERQPDAVETAEAVGGAGAPEGVPGEREADEPQPGNVDAERNENAEREGEPPRRRRRRDDRGRGRRRGPPPLPPDDPFWQFGTPPETWGSTVRRPERPRPRRPRAFLECRRCGIKMEKKRVHRDRVRCPMCGHWMREVRPPSE